MIKLAMMSLILALRMLGVLLLFVLLARKVPVDDFGRFSTCYGIGAVLAVLVDFGFSQSLLRDIARAPAAASSYISEGVSLKVLISAFVLLSSALYFLLLPHSFAVFGLQFLLLGYFLLNSFCEFYGTGLRATGNYTQEAGVQAIFTTTLILVLIFIKVDIYQVSILMLFLACIRVLAMRQLVRTRIGKTTLDFSMPVMKSAAIRGAAYAMDQGVGNLSSNADVLFVAHALGPTATGIYQAGQKIVQGLSASALVFSNVYLPKLAKFRPSDEEFKRASKHVALLMGGCALASFALLFLFASPLTDYLYGRNFAPLKSLLPSFAILILIRYLNAIMGLHLTALGTQKLRAIVNLVCLLVFIASCPFLIHAFGLLGVIYAQILGSIVTFGLYFVALIRILYEG